MIIILSNTETGQYETFSVDELLEMINRDRSDEWSEYTMESTLQEIEEAVDQLCSPYQTILGDKVKEHRKWYGR